MLSQVLNQIHFFIRGVAIIRQNEEYSGTP